jgi:hypothetical protein
MVFVRSVKSGLVLNEGRRASRRLVGLCENRNEEAA